MTKKEAKARKTAWQLALAEGRVVNWNNGFTLTSYATVEQAHQALEAILANGLSAYIVQV